MVRLHEQETISYFDKLINISEKTYIISHLDNIFAVHRAFIKKLSSEDDLKQFAFVEVGSHGFPEILSARKDMNLAHKEYEEIKVRRKRDMNPILDKLFLGEITGIEQDVQKITERFEMDNLISQAVNNLPSYVLNELLHPNIEMYPFFEHKDFPGMMIYRHMGSNNKDRFFSLKYIDPFLVPVEKDHPLTEEEKKSFILNKPILISSQGNRGDKIEDLKKSSREVSYLAVEPEEEDPYPMAFFRFLNACSSNLAFRFLALDFTNKDIREINQNVGNLNVFVNNLNELKGLHRNGILGLDLTNQQFGNRLLDVIQTLNSIEKKQSDDNLKNAMKETKEELILELKGESQPEDKEQKRFSVKSFFGLGR